MVDISAKIEKELVERNFDVHKRKPLLLTPVSKLGRQNSLLLRTHGKAAHHITETLKCAPSEMVAIGISKRRDKAPQSLHACLDDSQTLNPTFG